MKNYRGLKNIKNLRRFRAETENGRNILSSNFVPTSTLKVRQV